MNEQEAGFPDVEIVVRIDGRETAILAFFSDGSGGYEYVAGLEFLDDQMLVAELLAEALPVFRTCAFTYYVPPPEADALGGDRTDGSSPF